MKKTPEFEVGYMAEYTWHKTAVRQGIIIKVYSMVVVLDVSDDPETKRHITVAKKRIIATHKKWWRTYNLLDKLTEKDFARRIINP